MSGKAREMPCHIPLECIHILFHHKIASMNDYHLQVQDRIWSCGKYRIHFPLRGIVSPELRRKSPFFEEECQLQPHAVSPDRYIFCPNKCEMILSFICFRLKAVLRKALEAAYGIGTNIAASGFRRNPYNQNLLPRYQLS